MPTWAITFWPVRRLPRTGAALKSRLASPVLGKEKPNSHAGLLERHQTGLGGGMCALHCEKAKLKAPYSKSSALPPPSTFPYCLTYSPSICFSWDGREEFPCLQIVVSPPSYQLFLNSSSRVFYLFIYISHHDGMMSFINCCKGWSKPRFVLMSFKQ